MELKTLQGEEIVKEMAEEKNDLQREINLLGFEAT